LSVVRFAIFLGFAPIFTQESGDARGFQRAAFISVQPPFRLGLRLSQIVDLDRAPLEAGEKSIFA